MEYQSPPFSPEQSRRLCESICRTLNLPSTALNRLHTARAFAGMGYPQALIAMDEMALIYGKIASIRFACEQGPSLLNVVAARIEQRPGMMMTECELEKMSDVYKIIRASSKTITSDDMWFLTAIANAKRLFPDPKQRRPFLLTFDRYFDLDPTLVAQAISEGRTLDAYQGDPEKLYLAIEAHCQQNEELRQLQKEAEKAETAAKASIHPNPPPRALKPYPMTPTMRAPFPVATPRFKPPQPIATKPVREPLKERPLTPAPPKRQRQRRVNADPYIQAIIDAGWTTQQATAYLKYTPFLRDLDSNELARGIKVLTRLFGYTGLRYRDHLEGFARRHASRRAALRLVPERITRMETGGLEHSPEGTEEDRIAFLKSIHQCSELTMTTARSFLFGIGMRTDFLRIAPDLLASYGAKINILQLFLDQQQDAKDLRDLITDERQRMVLLLPWELIEERAAALREVIAIMQEFLPNVPWQQMDYTKNWARLAIPIEEIKFRLIVCDRHAHQILEENAHCIPPLVFMPTRADFVKELAEILIAET